MSRRSVPAKLPPLASAHPSGGGAVDLLCTIVKIQSQMADVLIWIADVLKEMRKPEDDEAGKDRGGQPGRILH